MQRLVALAIIASILSVSSIPLLPGSVHCAHAAEVAAGEDCTDCHNGKAVETALSAQDMSHEMCHDMAPRSHISESAHASHHGDHAMQQPAAHQRHQMTEAERECRIECGCGCNRIAKSFPLLLSPHVTASVDFDSSISVSPAVVLPLAELAERARRIPVPPPQLS